jgi:hypothetical protein
MTIGRPRFEPTEHQRQQVLLLTGLGVTQENIATVLDVAPKTLRRVFRRELDRGVIEANARVMQALYLNATKHNNVAAQIWWSKCRAGWKDTSDASDNTPLVVDFRWADTPAVAAPEGPVIEAAAEPSDDDTPEVTWASEAA